MKPPFAKQLARALASELQLWALRLLIVLFMAAVILAVAA